MNNSTINVCSLDVSKAFDKISHFALFSKLVDRSVPVNIVSILFNWYSNSFAAVSWNGILSDQFSVCAGIRQGGILSPVLFSVYLNSLIEKLQISGLGCHIGMLFMGALMYADDLVLLSASVHDLQLMINICVDELDCLDMKINAKKSSCIRFGKGFNTECAQVMVDGTPLVWSSSIKYLGIYLKSSVKFAIDIRNCRAGFYKSFNAIYCKLSRDNVDVVISLVKSICLPSLLYCIEVFDLNVSTLRSLDTPLFQAFGKIFKTFNKDIINSCLYYMNFMPARFDYMLRKIKFLKNNCKSANLLVSTLCRSVGSNELSTICQKLDANVSDSMCTIKDRIWKSLESVVV